MKFKTIILLIFLISIAHSRGIDPVTKIIEQENSPLIINSYPANYKKSGTYTTEGIHHTVKYENTSDRNVVAVQISLVSFDVWNEFLDIMGGISIEEIAPGKSEKGTWVARAYADFAFLTGFAYVKRVRFSDGTIWDADHDLIAEELQKLESDFDVQKLKDKPEK